MAMTNNDNTPRTAFVSGAGSGIGRATAVALARGGYRVGVFDLSRQDADATARLITDSGGSALSLAGDVSVDEDVAAAVDVTVAQLGPLAAVVACAGIGSAGTALTTSTAEWNKVIAVNLTGAFNTARHGIRELLKTGGSFTAIASDAGVSGYQDALAYGASKHGVVGLVRNLALDHGPQGVRSNVVCPGWVETPLMTQYFDGLSDVEVDEIRRSNPLGRFATASDVAAVVVHLASDAGRHTNGLVYVVDGGVQAGIFDPASVVPQAVDAHA